MNYIYCKNREDFEYMNRALVRAGYKKKGSAHDWILIEAARRNAAQRCGVTLYVSDDEMTISPRAGTGYKPKGYKPSKLMMGCRSGGVFHKINEPIDSGAWKDLKTDLATKLNTKLKTDIEPLDDTEELEVDREKLRKFAKDTKGKAKITLAPMQILKDVAEVREYGVKKYGSVDSWKEVPIEDYRDALFRHLLEYIKDPNSVDKESGIKHYKHIACNLAFICEMENTEDGIRSV